MDANSHSSSSERGRKQQNHSHVLEIKKKFSLLHAKRLDWKAMPSKAHLAEPAWKAWGKSEMAQLQGVHTAPGPQAQ